MTRDHPRGGGILVLAVSAVVFVVGGLVGFNLLTSGADTSVEAATCEERTLAAGDDLTPNLVTVNVYNASRTAGLANKVSVLMQRRGFLTGTVANNPTKIETSEVVILTSNPKDPRVELIRKQFTGKVRYVDDTIAGTDGISILVGRNNADRKLSDKGAKAKTVVDRSTTVCIPVLPVT